MIKFAIGLCLFFMLLAYAAYRRDSSSRYFLIGIASLALLALLFTYGKWEYLTRHYGTEFERIAVIEFDAARLPITTVKRADDIALLKVFSFNSRDAQLFIQDRMGNKWLMDLNRTSDDGFWTSRGDSAWQIEMIHSTIGGPAQQSFYWY